MKCVWENFDTPDANGYRRVRCIFCRYITRTRTNFLFEQIHGTSCIGAIGFRPGTELREMLLSLGIDEQLSCDCAIKENRMNQWGVEGCRIHRAEIVTWLRESYSILTNAEIAKAIVAAALSGLALRLNPFDICGSLLDESLRRAESSCPPTPPRG